jgi:AmmeMemoRadiSam system protein B
MIELIAQRRADEVVAEATLNQNACGSGAIAALLGAVQELGLTEYSELRHTCSAEIKCGDDPDPANSVGYEAGVFVG